MTKLNKYKFYKIKNEMVNFWFERLDWKTIY